MGIQDRFSLMMGLVAAATVAACNMDVAPNTADSSTNNPSDVVSIVDTNSTPDAGRTCTSACRPGFEHDQSCDCVSLCNPRCTPAQTCEVDSRTGIWDCVTVDAGTQVVDVQTPVVDNGPECVSGLDCSNECQNPSRPVGRTTCNPMRGCFCEPAAVVDAGTPVVDAPPSCSVSGQTLCGSACVDLQSNNANCGICGMSCGVGNRCQAGVCVLDCGAGTVACNGVCVNTSNTVANCGGCGRACAPRANTSVSCAAGGCVYTCLPNFAASDNNAANGCTINLLTDAANCGSRSNACPTGLAHASSACVNGTCRLACTDQNYLNVDGESANGCEVDVRTNESHCGVRGIACAVGSLCCNGICSDIRTDSLNCAACGSACPNGQGCFNGVCTGVCRQGQTVCRIDTREACTDLQSDPNNCGACGRTCSITNGFATCSNGVCGFGACQQGYANCDGSLTNGCEVNLNDARNCGTCGTVCPSGPNSTPFCSSYFGYNCGLTCSGGFRNCDGAASNGCEANINNDRANCGACGHACSSSQRCDAGSCVNDCVAPQVSCGARCLDTRTDVNNCGGCGWSFACATGINLTTTCRSSTCTYACAAGFADCDGDRWTGCEVNTTTTLNCGGCGVRCAIGQACTAGACVCPSGNTLCAGACTNPLTDASNCGGCGRSCASGQTCSAGACIGPAVVDAGTPDSGTLDSGFVDAGSDVGTDTGLVDAGTSDAGFADASTDVIPADSGFVPILCPSGTHPRSIALRLPPTVPAECAAAGFSLYSRPVLWGQSSVDRTRIQYADDVTIQMVGNPAITPEFSVLFPSSGSLLTSLPMRLLNTAFWPRGVVFYMTGRCNDRLGTYYENFGYWSRFITLQQAGGSFIVDGVERAGEVFSDGRVLSYTMNEPCLPN